MTDTPGNQSAGSDDDQTTKLTGRTAVSPYDRPTEEISVPRTDDDIDLDGSAELAAYRPNFGKSETSSVPTAEFAAVRLDDTDDATPGRYAFEPDNTVAPAGSAATRARTSPRSRGRDDEPRGRGTTDLGLLILRLMVGGVFLYHGLQKLTGWWGGPGLDGMEAGLARGGWDQAKLNAIMLTVAEVGGGALLILGLATPLAGGALLAVIIDAWLVKQAASPGLQYGGDGGTELEAILVGATAAVILLGPGRIALDGGRGWATRPYVGSLLCFVLGVVAAACAWIFMHGGNPFI